MSPVRVPALAALACTLVAACSPESRTTDPSPAEVPFQSGSLSGTTVGRVGAAQTTSGPGATLTGLVGTFTSLSAGGPGLGSVSTVYFTARGPRFDNIWQVRTDGTGLLRLTQDDTTREFGPSVSPSGDRLLFWSSGSETVLTERAADGTTRPLIADTFATATVAWTPDEAEAIYPVLAHFELLTAIRRVNLANLTVDTIGPVQEGRVEDLIVRSVNGHAVAIYRNPTNGLNLLDLTTGLDTAYFTPANSVVSSPDLTQDGSRILFIVSPGDAPHSQLRVGDVNHPEAAESVFTFPNENFANEARWLRDGSGIVISMHPTVPGQPPDLPFLPGFEIQQLFLLTPAGRVVRQVTNLPQNVSAGFSVGPATAATPRELIGDDGLLGTSASGIIFGQNQTGGLTAVVGFVSDRPRSVTLEATTGLNSTGPALIYRLTADGLRTLRFINDPPGGTPITVVDSASGPAGGALINIDADHGTVSLVLPFAAGTNVMPTVSQSGATRTFHGRFLGVWQGRTNLAPQGASQVKLETATGKVEVTP